jgi:hypothetical protein
MKTRLLPAALLTAMSMGLHADESPVNLDPDTIYMNDGTAKRGLIIRNDPDVVVLQQRMGEKVIPKAYISRIDDEANDVYFADMVKPGKLPPWRMIVMDLRSDDSIRSFRQIPATTVEKGVFARIPYLSFRINRRVEMNVYGNPEDPVAIEFGIYERKASEITRFKKITRTYLAGRLDSRHEIAALYSLDDKGGEKTVGDLTFQVTPPDAPDSDGGWWISIYEQKRLDAFRVPDAIYRKNTLPFGEVNHGNGVLRDGNDAYFDKFLQSNMKAWSSMIPDLRGFYRDKVGDLKLLMSKKPSSANP